MSARAESTTPQCGATPPTASASAYVVAQLHVDRHPAAAVVVERQHRGAIILLVGQQRAVGGIAHRHDLLPAAPVPAGAGVAEQGRELGRASCRERVCPYV